MKIKLIVLFIGLIGVVFAEEIDFKKSMNPISNKINYYNIEVVNNLPTIFGLGSRNIFNHHGYDFNISLDPIDMFKNRFRVLDLQSNLNYLFSFSKNASSIYTGIGINSFTQIDNDAIFEMINPCLSIGSHFKLFKHLSFVELKGNCFRQAGVLYNRTLYKMDRGTKKALFNTPTVSVRFGIGF
jgi:hypothetical protein